MEASGNPSISRAPMGGAMLSEYQKLVYADDRYEGRAKSSVTNRLLYFYPRYILKCFTALEWCVE